MKNVFPKIPKEEYSVRIANFREKMKEKNIDLVVIFSNLLDPSAVRYFTNFAAVNESSALVVPADGKVVLCSGQASSDYAYMQNALEGSEVKVFPEVGEVSGFEYDFGGQLDFAEFFKSLAKEYPHLRKKYILHFTLYNVCFLVLLTLANLLLRRCY